MAAAAAVTVPFMVSTISAKHICNSGEGFAPAFEPEILGECYSGIGQVHPKAEVLAV